MIDATLNPFVCFWIISLQGHKLNKSATLFNSYVRFTKSIQLDASASDLKQEGYVRFDDFTAQAYERFYLMHYLGSDCSNLLLYMFNAL